MRQRVIDNRPDIDTEITEDCPVTRRILAINLFICSVITVLVAWQIYQKTSLAKPLSVLLACVAIPMIRGGIWYIRSIPRKFNSDLQIMIYGMTFLTTIAIIKWIVFWYWGIDVRKMPTVYEKWDSIFNIVSIAVAGAAAGLPDIMKQKARQKQANKSGE
ncbi:MAG: hypothetical protein GX569_11595 [Candidatus Riflebacteria bacterium]|nr:hypothetical protein [Candidatus Riflebacteria bacterium]